MRVVIIGSGPVGMTAALLLARQGHPVTLIDRDPGPVRGRAWDRVGVMQFHLPHGFRPQCRTLLQERLPDVLEAVIAAGASVPIATGGPPSDPAANSAPLLVRRSVFERAFWQVVTAEPGISRLTGHAEAVEVAAGRATGVVVDSALVEADLVVDAGGRAGHATRPYREVGQRVDCGMAYAARLYRLRLAADPGPTNGGPAYVTQHRGFSTLVFQHDAGTFTVLFVRPAADKALARLRHASAFEAACRAVPGVSEWTDPRRSEPIDVVRAGAGLTNEFRGQPAGITGLVAIGDAQCVTNPQGARGIPLGLQSAAMLADLVAQVPIVDLAGRLDAWAARHTLPWFQDHVTWDASLLGLWSGRPVDPDGPIGPEVIFATARQHHPEWLPMLGLYLGMIRTPDMLEPLRAEVRALLRTGWQPPQFEGVTRDDLVSLITHPNVVQLNAATPVSA